MRFLGSAAVLAAAVLALTACGSQAAPPTATPSITVAPKAVPTDASSPTPSPTAPDGPDLPGTPGPTASADPASGRLADQCPDGDLGVTVVPADGGGSAGSEHLDVLITNTGGSTCALRGAPAVAVLGSGDERLGRPADRVRTGARTVRLRSGETVAAPLQVVDIGTDGGPLDGCTVRSGTGYRVVPPGSTKGFVVEDPTARACASGPVFMTVGPLVRFTD